MNHTTIACLSLSLALAASAADKSSPAPVQSTPKLETLSKDRQGEIRRTMTRYTFR